MQIRPETRDDDLLIDVIQYAAFRNHPRHESGAEPTEHRIVRALRDAGALTLSLLIEERGEAVGHIALSPAAVGREASGWHLLGPVGVLPGHQGRGLGTALVRAAVRQMKTRDALGIVLVGDPGFYGRFGFTQVPGLAWPGVPDQYVLALPLADRRPVGDIACHSAFHVR